jgi:predicted DNA binding CopG/RHH family protein
MHSDSSFSSSIRPLASSAQNPQPASRLPSLTGIAAEAEGLHVAKNEQLLAAHGLCFEAVIVAIETGNLLDVREHPNPQRYPEQRILIVRLNGYVHFVPFVETDEHFFLMINSPSPSFIPEEQQLLSDFNAGELRSVATPELLDALRQSATAMGVKDQRINIRLSSADLQALRVKALQEGIPYQTLISSVLHKYVSDSLLDRSVA